MPKTAEPMTDQERFRYRTDFWVMPEKRRLWVRVPRVRPTAGIPYRLRVSVYDEQELRRVRSLAVDDANLMWSRDGLARLLAYAHFVPEGGWLKDAEGTRIQSPVPRLAERENPKEAEEPTP